MLTLEAQTFFLASHPRGSAPPAEPRSRGAASVGAWAQSPTRHTTRGSRTRTAPVAGGAGTSVTRGGREGAIRRRRDPPCGTRCRACRRSARRPTGPARTAAATRACGSARPLRAADSAAAGSHIRRPASRPRGRRRKQRARRYEARYPGRAGTRSPCIGGHRRSRRPRPSTRAGSAQRGE